MYSFAMLNYFVAEEEVDPQGIRFCEIAAGLTTSLAARLVALWVKGTLIGSCYGHLMALLLPLSI